MKEKLKKLLEIFQKNKFLTIFVCIFLSIVIIFGATLGIIMGVIKSRAVIKYESTRLDEGEVIYLASLFKSSYIASLVKGGNTKARDNSVFWSSASEIDGKTQGDLLREAFVEYISGIAVKNSLYLDTERFTSSQKKDIKALLDTRLSYLGCDSKKDFNLMSDKLGFDYDDMLDASYLLYKANTAFPLIYGDDGSNLKNFTSECDKYLNTYSHVALIFIRSEDVYVFDEEGKLTYDDEGQIVTRPLTAEERAEREGNAEKLRTYIKNLNEGLSGAITPETFELYMKEHSDTDPEYINRGYYFHPSAQATAEFYEVYPEVVERALDMEIGEYSEVSCSDGVCFIYRYDVAKNAYADTTNVFFTDFFSDGAAWCFGENIKALSEGVSFAEEFSNIDIVSIPSNSKYVIKGYN